MPDAYVPHDHRSRVDGCFRCELSADETEDTTMSDRMTEIAWLRGKVEQLTPDTREGMAQMGEWGDLDEGYILALLEAAEHVIAELDRLRAERTAMLDAIEAAAGYVETPPPARTLRQAEDLCGLLDRVRDLLGDDDE